VVPQPINRPNISPVVPQPLCSPSLSIDSKATLQSYSVL
jgi:hypothetical protein